MMIRKMPKWIAGVAIALIAGAAPLACGGGGGTDNMAGAGNDEDGTGGTDGATGGNDNDGSGGGDTDGTAPADASIDDLISAICQWEYGCCDGGEVSYRLGTAAGQSVDDCVEYF